MTDQDSIFKLPINPKHLRVLVVDDDFAARLQIKFTLENDGFEVIEAASGEEAIEQFKHYSPDLVLLDVIMPGMNGCSTCSVLRKQPKGEYLPIIMVTGLEDEETIVNAFEAGATDFISKPINMLVIGYRVRYWLRAGATVQALKKSQQNLFKAQGIARLGHWEKNLRSGAFQFTSPSPEIFGLSYPFTYTMLFDCIVEEDRGRVEATIENACTKQQPFSLNYRIVLPDGSERIILNQGEVVQTEQQLEPLLIGIVQDITALKQAEDKIRYLAYYDNLTGLANRSLFLAHWLKILPHAKRTGKKIGILFLDLDHFKQINDTLGHPSGDKVLIGVADRLKSIFRKSDIIGRPGSGQLTSMISRIGGDEFTIIAVDIDQPEHAAKLAERIIEAVCQPIELGEQLVHLTASVGISLYPEDGTDIDVLLKNADTAMYEAKQAGRNMYKFYQKGMNDAVRARFMLGNRLRRALKNEEFTLYYQPQYANNHGNLKGVEALIRWIDPQRGLVPPDEFLPFAEESGFIHSINEWVIRKACFQAKEWVDTGRFDGCRVGVNVSGSNINFDKLLVTITEALEDAGLAPRYLELELTERVMMDNTDDARSMLLELKKMGVAIAIDDFGTGYSALSHLQLFPLTTLKIDKSFVQNIDKEGSNSSLLPSIVAIAKSFNLNVVAEGVETEKQCAALGTMECDELQGYFFSKPLPYTEIEALLNSSP